ncbi:MAG: DUF1592 domain-containing protein [Deltaproteobacteria bacterium]|nr:DUF1592 domain-containing protein [Deltaproteobacteria bacterium]
MTTWIRSGPAQYQAAFRSCLWNLAKRAISAGALAVLFTPMLACTGAITPTEKTEKGEGPGAPSGSGGRPATTATVEDPPVPASELAVAQGAMRRLTKAQFRNAVGDLLKIPVTANFLPEPIEQGFVSVAAAENALAPVDVANYESSISDAVDRWLGDRARVEKQLGCKPALNDAACLKSAIAAVGLRAWRRPLEATEIGVYADAAKAWSNEQGDPFAGVALVMNALLQSPNFLYRFELGQGATEGPRRLLSAFELATRMSFFLWNTQPDDELLDAAATGALSTASGLAQQLKRMLSSEKASNGIRQFGIEMVELEKIAQIDRDKNDFPMFTAGLPSAMAHEIEMLFESLLKPMEGSLLSILNNRRAHIDRQLAKVYGLGDVPASGFTPVTMPADSKRSGLLGTAGFLAVTSKRVEASPTLRGRFVRESLLCETIPPPPPNVNSELPAVPPGATQREILEIHMTNPACASCHALTDPIGFAFANFDAIGAFHEQEAGRPVDASGDLDGKSFKNSAELGALLVDDPRTRFCLVRQLVRYALGRFDPDVESSFASFVAPSMDADENDTGALLNKLISSRTFQQVRGTEDAR